MTNVSCSFDGCVRFVKTHGLCSAHYQQKRAGKELKPLKVAVPHALCRFQECGLPALYRGLCNTHNLQRIKWGEDGMRPLRKKSADPDGWITTSEGYIARSVKTEKGVFRHQLQHRFVMEQKIGRKLLPGENVHHINGDRADNRIENLELWSKSQPAGQRVSDKIRWAKEILATYGIDPTIYEGKSHK